MKEASFIVPGLLPVCCVCGLIRDERGASLGVAPWLTPQIYRNTHGIEPNDSSLTHTYCPTCLTQDRETGPQCAPQIGGSL